MMSKGPQPQGPDVHDKHELLGVTDKLWKNQRTEPWQDYSGFAGLVVINKNKKNYIIILWYVQNNILGK